MIEIASGQPISSGFSFDISYDAALDHIVPGYKIVNIGIKNTSMDSFLLNVSSDHWVVLDQAEHSYEATMNLKESDPQVWATLSPEIQGAFTFPLVIPGGVSQALDLFVKSDADLNGFHAVLFRSSFLKHKIKILNVQ